MAMRLREKYPSAVTFDFWFGFVTENEYRLSDQPVFFITHKMHLGLWDK